MCYSNGYKYRDGDVEMYSTGLSMQLAACHTSSAMKGGKRMTKRMRKGMKKSIRKSIRKRIGKRIHKRKSKKYIALY